MTDPDTPARPDLYFDIFDRAGEMGRRIRDFDWSRTKLGPIAAWPQSLRTAVGMMLGSEQAKVILWGREGILIYNDSYSEFAGRRHPEVLGSEVLVSWPELAQFNANVLNTVLGGGMLSYQGQHLAVQRNGETEEIWLDLDYCPILDESGKPGGVLALVAETTQRVRAEERLRIAQQAAKVGTFEWFPQTASLIGSEEYCRIWGFPPDIELTDQLVLSCIVPEDVPNSGNARLDWDNPLEYSEYRIRRFDTGAERWIGRRGEAMAGVDGGPRRFVGVAFDVTDAKLAAEAAQRSNRRLRQLFEQMQEGFFVGEAIRDASHRMVDFRFAEVNPAFEELTGISGAHAVGRSVRAVLPHVPEHIIDSYAEVLRTRQSAQMEVFMSDLGDHWYETRIHPLSDERFAVLFLDITQRKAIEIALAESETRFRTLAQSMPNHVWTATPAGNLDWFNDQVYRFTGQAPGSLDGAGWGDIVYPDDLPGAVTAWQAALVQGTPYETKFRLRAGDGAYRWHIARALPIRDADDRITRWIGTNTDIEDQNAATQALATLADTLEERVAARTEELAQAHEALRQSQKMETIGQLTGGIAHDFNNLLQGIIGSLDLIHVRISQGRIGELERFVNGAIASANRAAGLTHRLLAFSRRQPLDPKPVKPNPLISSMEDLLRRTLGEQTSLELALAGGLWLTLCDPNQLESGILNLAINARDAMPGGGKLIIETGNAHLDAAYAVKTRDVKPGQYVCISVTDTGAGMTPDVLGRAFDPFFTTKPIGQGTGLGLSMIYGFARQSEGYVKIYSEPGHGTSVKLYLPRYRGAVNDDDVAAVTVAPTIAAGEVVLVVEDEPVVRGLVVEVLNELGYQAIEAADGVTGLDIVQSRRKIDLLVTDIGLPGLNGRQLADGARAIRPELGVLFMTGYAENAALATGFLEPGMAMITKPFSMDALSSRIRQMVEKA